MHEPDKHKRKAVVRWVTLAAALAVLAGMAGIWYFDHPGRVVGQRTKDEPPTIDLTWTPLGPARLQDFKGFLTLKDDYALDFKTYRFRLVELDRTLDMPIDGLVGKEYGSDIYLSLLANDPIAATLSRLTIEISIADDKGQKTTIDKVVRLLPQSAPETQLEVK